MIVPVGDQREIRGAWASLRTLRRRRPALYGGLPA